MSSRALVFPSGSVEHLPATDLATHQELADLARLEGAGVRLGLVALPGAIEEAFYRLNNLPWRLASLYQGLDPLDPDEDIVEEAESAAARLLSESYLLDDLIDGIYASLTGLPEPLVVRRAGTAGVEANGARAALLAVKRCFRDDWSASAVLDRLAVTTRLGVEARPVLVHGVPVGAARGADAADIAAEVSAVLDRRVKVMVDERGAIVRVTEADLAPPRAATS